MFQDWVANTEHNHGHGISSYSQGPTTLTVRNFTRPRDTGPILRILFTTDWVMGGIAHINVISDTYSAMGWSIASDLSLTEVKAATLLKLKKTAELFLLCVCGVGEAAWGKSSGKEMMCHKGERVGRLFVFIQAFRINSPMAFERIFPFLGQPEL